MARGEIAEIGGLAFDVGPVAPDVLATQLRRARDGLEGGVATADAAPAPAKAKHWDPGVFESRGHVIVGTTNDTTMPEWARYIGPDPRRTSRPQPPVIPTIMPPSVEHAD